MARSQAFLVTPNCWYLDFMDSTMIKQYLTKLNPKLICRTRGEFNRIKTSLDYLTGNQGTLIKPWPKYLNLTLIKFLTFLFFLASLNCGIYTFSGSTLPSHLKTVDIPLFLNQSLQPGISEQITVELQKYIQDNNILKTVPNNGNGSINGKVLSYKNQPVVYDYDSQESVNVTVTSYAVEIAVEIEFLDNKKDKALYKGVLTQEGIYDFNKETEEDGQKRAIKKIVDLVIQNSVQGW